MHNVYCLKPYAAVLARSTVKKMLLPSVGFLQKHCGCEAGLKNRNSSLYNAVEFNSSTNSSLIFCSIGVLYKCKGVQDGLKEIISTQWHATGILKYKYLK